MKKKEGQKEKERVEEQTRRRRYRRHLPRGEEVDKGGRKEEAWSDGVINGEGRERREARVR